jgi:hypothetical protein
MRKDFRALEAINLFLAHGRPESGTFERAPKFERSLHKGEIGLILEDGLGNCGIQVVYRVGVAGAELISETK